MSRVYRAFSGPAYRIGPDGRVNIGAIETQTVEEDTIPPGQPNSSSSAFEQLISTIHPSYSSMMPMTPPSPPLWMQGLGDTFNIEDAKRCLRDMADNASLWILEVDMMNNRLANKIDELKTGLGIMISKLEDTSNCYDADILANETSNLFDNYNLLKGRYIQWHQPKQRTLKRSATTDSDDPNNDYQSGKRKRDDIELAFE